MELTITIDTGNAAFGDDLEFEVRRILRELGDQIQLHGLPLTPRKLRDANGNTVGVAHAA